MIIREYYAQLDANKLDNLGELGQIPLMALRQDRYPNWVLWCRVEGSGRGEKGRGLGLPIVSNSNSFTLSTKAAGHVLRFFLPQILFLLASFSFGPFSTMASSSFGSFLTPLQNLLGMLTATLNPGSWRLLPWAPWCSAHFPFLGKL